MAQAMFLEDFETMASGAQSASDVAADPQWLAGYQQAMEEVALQADVDRIALSEALVQALSDKAFTYAEAREAVLAALRPMFEELVSHFMPALAQEAFVPLIIDRLMAAAAVDSSAGLMVFVAPEHLPEVEEAASQVAGTPVVCRSDPSIPAFEARITHRELETALDVPDLLASCVGLLASLSGGPASDTRAEVG